MSKNEGDQPFCISIIFYLKNLTMSYCIMMRPVIIPLQMKQGIDKDNLFYHFFL